MSNAGHNETRPPIASISSGAELKRWYWRKSELVERARELGVKTTSGKFIILERIAYFLDTGEVQYPRDVKIAVKSSFDWHKEELNKNTVITDSYKNTQNVRRYFKASIGDSFKFNIAFMEWMTANIGRTLDDACVAYESINVSGASKGSKTKIKEHNQFNQYTRDFLADNPKLGMNDVRMIWAQKIQRPSETGRHVYDRSDLTLK